MKRFLALILSVLFVLSLSACGGGKDTAKSTDPKALADDMLAALAPVGETIEVTGDVAANYYTLGDEVKEYRIYLSTMYIAEEVAVFRVSDTDKIADVTAICQQRISDLKDNFEDYLPEEYAAVNDNAAVLSAGDIVALVIGSKDGVAAAKAVFDKALS